MGRPRSAGLVPRAVAGTDRVRRLSPLRPTGHRWRCVAREHRGVCGRERALGPLLTDLELARIPRVTLYDVEWIGVDHKLAGRLLGDVKEVEWSRRRIPKHRGSVLVVPRAM